MKDGKAKAALGRPGRRGEGAQRLREREDAALEAAGFEIETWRENSEYRFVSERADNATRKYGVTSISALARKG